MHGDRADGICWMHFGDLHIEEEHRKNYADFLSIVEEVNTHLAGRDAADRFPPGAAPRDRIDFCVLPGDNADDGTPEQYALIRRGLDRLQIPVHVIPGDHDFKQRSLQAFHAGLRAPGLPRSVIVGDSRCVFLDVVSNGGGGPDFHLGGERLRWLEQELRSARELGQPCVVFMHAYPADLARDGAAVHALLRDHRVSVVDMGHTHYNEVANDGTTIFTTTRSTGQIEEGEVGFSITALTGGVVSWRFKPLAGTWPFVLITSPADHRLVTDVHRPDQVVSGDFVVKARVFGGPAVARCRCRIGDGPWQAMRHDGISPHWQAACAAPPHAFDLSVEATDAAGSIGLDQIRVAVPGHRPPDGRVSGGDAAIAGWPERHLLGTRLGPNANGRSW